MKELRCKRRRYECQRGQRPISTCQKWDHNSCLFQDHGGERNLDASVDVSDRTSRIGIWLADRPWWFGIPESVRRRGRHQPSETVYRLAAHHSSGSPRQIVNQNLYMKIWLEIRINRAELSNRNATVTLIFTCPQNS